jgi:hypothetical protein
MQRKIIPYEKLPDDYKKEFAIEPGDYLEIKQGKKRVTMTVKGSK